MNIYTYNHIITQSRTLIVSARTNAIICKYIEGAAHLKCDITANRLRPLHKDLRPGFFWKYLHVYVPI